MRDANVLTRYLADDFVYQMVEGELEIRGKDTFVSTLEDVLARFQSIDMRIIRHVAIGQLVMSERLDSLVGKDPDHSMRFSVASYSVVYAGKISALRDYPIRGGAFELGAAFR